MKFALSGILAIIVFAAPHATWGAYNDVTLTTDTVLTLGSVTLNVSGSSAEIASIVVNSDNFTVALDDRSSIKVSSAGRYDLNVDNNAVVTSETCTSTESTMTLASTNASAVQTVTVTPTTNVCQSSGGSGTGGGGSSGGGTKAPAKAPAKPRTPSTPSSPSAPAPSSSFTSDLTLGSSGEDVRALQVYLNTHGFVIAQSGPGSPGNETMLFGALTQAALARFQASVGITPASGYFGPKTRAHISGSSTQAEPAPSQPQAPAISGSFTRDLALGAIGDDVRLLQAYLNAHGLVIAQSGPGSPGNETMLFGALTQAALARFQASVGITPASGYFGPKTRAYITAHP